MNLKQYINTLPYPLCDEKYRVLKKGIWDDANISVYINAADDFAFLFPCPSVGYERYVTRSQKLGLEKDPVRFQRRYDKCRAWLSGREKVLEIGASDGSFLRVLQEALPNAALFSVEPDTSTLNARAEIRSLRDYDSIAGAKAEGYRFDVICHFHVFEHILHPAQFLADTGSIMNKEGIWIAEIPSLDDPLLSLYQNKAYENFFFQRQHPFNYSRSSIERVLQEHGFEIADTIPHQRYGLDNHATWMQTGQPGGNQEWRAVLGPADDAYRRTLEESSLTDAIIVVAARAEEQVFRK